MDLKGIIENYNSAILPLSRNGIVRFLRVLIDRKSELNSVEKKFVEDFEIEFSYDLSKNLDSSISLVNSFGLNTILDDNKSKHIFAYADENASIFFDGTGFLSYRNFNMESSPKSSIGLGELGLRIRGSLYNDIGYYLHLSNGQQISGDAYSRNLAAKYDPKLISNVKFLNEKYFDSFEGYLRFESESKVLSVTFGREKLSMGRGYLDKMILSGYGAPFDFGKIDINYKALQYSFFYGNLRGDSLGTPLTSKNIIAHRLDINFSQTFRLGIFESIIASNRPISFTYLNPLSFITSADFSSETKNESNAVIGLDFELKLMKNTALQMTLLIDDLNFKTISRNDASRNDNKFGYQIGLMYTDPFGLENLTITFEFTHIDPFVYSHRLNKSTYTNWGVGLGHQLSPNSDEIAILFSYSFSSRLITSLKYQFQRSGQGIILDANGNLIRNYGSDINRGDGDFNFLNTFLMGNRVNRNIITFHLRFEPIRQYYLNIDYSMNFNENKTSNYSYKDQFFNFTISTDF